MNLRAIFAALAFAVSLPALAATAGQPAPSFTLADTKGNTIQLSDFKGKYVVLEWTNPGCPFVRTSAPR
jgi:peroxiredoxin